MSGGAGRATDSEMRRPVIDRGRIYAVVVLDRRYVAISSSKECGGGGRGNLATPRNVRPHRAEPNVEADRYTAGVELEFRLLGTG